MDKRNIPVELWWMIPIVEELRSREPDGYISDEYRETVEKQLDLHARKVLDEWLDNNETKESSEFYMATILLTEMGFLRGTESTDDYETWFSLMNSPVWGKRRNAIKEIGRRFLDQLSSIELDQLANFVQEQLKTESNPNTLIWLNWLFCKLGIDANDAYRQIGRITTAAISNFDESNDVIEDGFSALFDSPNVSITEIRLAENAIFSTSDYYDSVCILESVINSNFVSESEKNRIRQRVKMSELDELKDVFSQKEKRVL